MIYISSAKKTQIKKQKILKKVLLLISLNLIFLVILFTRNKVSLLKSYYADLELMDKNLNNQVLSGRTEK